MRYLVTGAAGFIGSRLCLRLLEEGGKVLGVDSLSDYYPRWIKEANLRRLSGNRLFTFCSQDILSLDLDSLMEGVDIVFHLAAQPGVRASWGKHFSVYVRNNIESTQRLLESAKDTTVKKFVYASSSSVYGLCPDLPMRETSLPLPHSPYGVTKLAAEQLCSLYFRNHGVPCVSLRYFTVYGPGQRPDMAFHRFFKSILAGKEILIFGDGKQTRDFTFVDDVVEASLAAARTGKEGEAYNIGGGSRTTLSGIIPLLESTCGAKVHTAHGGEQKGDVRHTLADISKAKEELRYAPETALEDGLREEWNWIRSLYRM